MELLPGAAPEQARAAIQQLKIELGNRRGGGWGQSAVIARDEYLRAIESAELRLRSFFVGEWWLHQLQTERYWHIRELTESSARPFPLIGDEVEWQLAWCDRILAELDALIREDAAADTTAARAVLDTNVYLHFRPIGEIDWLAQLGQPAVRLLLPIAVLGELDNQKNGGRARLRARAAKRLASFRGLLAGRGRGRGPADLRQGVSLEVVLDPPGHVPCPNTDEEVMIVAQRLADRRGGPVLLVTGDLSMQLRAEARGLTVVELPDDLRLPLDADIDEG
jgi:hypothetical protein